MACTARQILCEISPIEKNAVMCSVLRQQFYRWHFYPTYKLKHKTKKGYQWIVIKNTTARILAFI